MDNLLDSRNELAQLDHKIAEYKELREKKAQELAEAEQAEKENSNKFITVQDLANVCEHATRAAQCIKLDPEAYSTDVLKKRSKLKIELLNTVAKWVNGLLPEASSATYCAHVVFDRNQVVDANADEDDLLATPLCQVDTNLRVEIGKCFKECPYYNGNKCPHGAGCRGEESPTESEAAVQDAFKTLLAVEAGLSKKGLAKIAPEKSKMLAVKKLDGATLKKKFNFVVENLLKLFPNCGLVTIPEGASAAEIITAVLTGTKVILKLYEKYKQKKTSKKSK